MYYLGVVVVEEMPRALVHQGELITQAREEKVRVDKRGDVDDAEDSENDNLDLDLDERKMRGET